MIFLLKENMRPFKNQIISISGFITKNTLGWNLSPQTGLVRFESVEILVNELIQHRGHSARGRARFFWANDKMNWQEWYSRAIFYPIICYTEILHLITNVILTQ